MALRFAVAALLAAAAAACSVLPADSPSDAVRRALARVVAHDLAGASLTVCEQRRDPTDFPFSISGIFEPVGALPGFDVPRTLAVIQLDATRLSVVETKRDGDAAAVDVTGVLVERFDPQEVETLFRAYATESGQPVEEDLLRETLANVSGGDVELVIDESVLVVREAGTWKVCPPAPTP